MVSFVAYKPIENTGFLPFDLNEGWSIGLQGREQELIKLDTALQDNQVNIIQVSGPAGVGKTALIQGWLKRLHERGWPAVDAVYGWAFTGVKGQYSIATMLEEFLDQALAWFGLLSETTSTYGYEEKITLLSHCLQQQRIILLLDNIAADMVLDVTGNASLYGLLHQLGSRNNGLCVLGLNEPISLDDLGAVYQVLTIELEDLTPDDGALLLRDRGLKGSLYELAWVSHQFANHAFTLTLLASCVKNLLNGDIRQLDNIPILMDRQVHGRQARRLLAAYEQSLRKSTELALLYFLSVFDGAITCQELLGYFKESFCIRFPFRRNPLPKPVVALRCLKLEKLKGLQQRLYEFSLLTSPATSDVLLLPPLVRDYFRQKLQTRTPDAWQALCQITSLHQTSSLHAPRPTKLVAQSQSMAAESDRQVLAMLEQQLTQMLKTRDWQQAALIALQLQERYARLGNAPAALHCARQSAAYHAIWRDQTKMQQQVRALAEFLQTNPEQLNLNPMATHATAVPSVPITSLVEMIKH